MLQSVESRVSLMLKLSKTSWNTFQTTGATKCNQHPPFKRLQYTCNKTSALHSQRLPLTSSSAPRTKPWTSRSTSVFATMLEASRESLTHFHSFCYCHRLRSGSDCGWQSDGMLCTVHACKPYNPIKRGSVYVLAAESEFMEVLLTVMALLVRPYYCDL